jgi:hypothetical protein
MIGVDYVKVIIVGGLIGTIIFTVMHSTILYFLIKRGKAK